MEKHMYKTFKYLLSTSNKLVLFVDVLEDLSFRLESQRN